MMGGALIFPTFTYILYLNDKNPGGESKSGGGGGGGDIYILSIQNPALTFY